MTDQIEWNPVPADENDPRIQAALDELRTMILRPFPAATFSVRHGEDPDALWLEACIDVDDPDIMLDTVLDRLVDMHIEALPVYVMSTQPLERHQRIYREAHPDYVPRSSRGG